MPEGSGFHRDDFVEPDLQARGLPLQVTLAVRPDALGRPLLDRLGDRRAAPIGIADPDAARHGDSPSWFAGMGRVAVVFIYTTTRTSCLGQERSRPAGQPNWREHPGRLGRALSQPGSAPAGA